MVVELRLEPSRESASAVLVGVVVGDDVEFKSGVVVLPALGGPDIGPAQHTTEHLEQRGESPSCPNARLYESRSLGHIDETQTTRDGTDTSRTLRNLNLSSSCQGHRAPPSHACDERTRGSSDLIQYITRASRKHRAEPPVGCRRGNGEKFII